MYDKPFKTYEEQLKIIKEKYKLNIPNEQFAMRFLKTSSYYTIVNGYKEIFMDNEIYRDDINFNEIVGLLAFEKLFLFMILRYSIFVEEFFKTKLAYTISKNIDVDYNIYLKKQYYSIPRTRKTKFSDTINKIKDIAKNTTDPPTIYYRENHNHIPAWILFKNVYFNECIDLFSFLKDPMQDEIINEYNNFFNLKTSHEKKLKNFKKMLTTVRKFRNKIAHNGKVFNYTLKKSECIIYNEIKQIFPRYIMTKNEIESGGLYSLLISILTLLGDSFWQSNFAKEISIVLKTIPQDIIENYFKVAKLPSNIIERFERIYAKLFTELYNDK